tara:strand:- start:975 stop:1292 length:318 start_codon:yes stop_codon:yes gene_type:complete
VRKEIHTEILYENKKILAFNDISPQAPVHILLIPKKHISTLNDLTENEKELVGDLIYNASVLADKKGISENGYRVGFNCNKDGGQTVYHVHLHLLGGREFGWPPG